MTSREQAEGAIIDVLGNRSMTATEIAQATGYRRDLILSIVRGQRFMTVGTRRVKNGPCATAYQLRTPFDDDAPAADPLSVQYSLIVQSMAANQLDIARMIRRLALDGNREAALIVAKVWRSDDRELKRICERMTG